jgi:hypothetical protein
MTQPDTYERIALFFCRLLQRDTTERPRFQIEPLPGAWWGAAVYLGDPPAPFKELYLRNGVIKADCVIQASPGHFYWAAVATSASRALVGLEQSLVQALKNRIEGDLAIWDQATGTPWPGVAPVPRIEARPDDPDPAELQDQKRRQRLLSSGKWPIDRTP